MNKRNFGKFLETLRKERDLTQKQLAEKFNVKEKAVISWEKGRKYPKAETIEKLATEFNVTINELLEGKRIPEEENVSISKKQLVKKIRRNKTLKTLKIVLAVSFSLVLVIAILLNQLGFSSNCRYKYIDSYSDDVITILDNIDRYISNRPKTDGEYIIDRFRIYINSDKTIDAGSSFPIRLYGTCKNGRYFEAHAIHSENTGKSKLGLTEYFKNQESAQGIAISELKSIISQLDFSLLEESEPYLISHEDYPFQGFSFLENDVFISDFDFYNGQNLNEQIFIFSDGVLKKYDQKPLTGKFICFSIISSNKPNDMLVGYILKEVI